MARKGRTQSGGGDDWDGGQFDDFDPSPGQGGPGDEGPGGDEGEGLSGDDEQFEAACQVCEQLQQRLLRDAGPAAAAIEGDFDEPTYGLENIVGVGVGETATGEPCVQVYVSHKPESRDQVQAEAAVSEDIDGVRVEHVEVGEFFAQVNPKARYRPAPGGVSISPADKRYSGTLGGLVCRGRELYALSNHHVLVGNCDGAGRKGKAIVQPSIPDGGRPADVIATLSEWVPINFRGGANKVDAAVARTSARLCRPEILGIGRPSRTAVAPRIGLNVRKCGRTTAVTVGRVTAVNVSVRVNYGACGVALMTGQFMVRSTVAGRSFSQPGDSGSLVLAQPGNHPVGLLFAGNGTDTICNPISEVLRALRVTLA